MDPVIGYSSWYSSMVDYLASIDPVLAALYATLFTWFLTAAGAGLVFFFKTLHRGVLDAMLGFTGGVMVAASFWSLLAPSIEMSESMYPSMKWMPAAVGFLVGALFLFGLDKILPHLHINFREEEKEGVKTEWHKTTLLVLAITLHNIPEGLAVGVVFGVAGMGIDGVTTAAAVSLAIGIGIQNFPEGFAVSMPLRRAGFSKRKSWKWGQLSAIVEPIFAVIGAALVLIVWPILPYALSFAAGAMIFIVVEEVIPESQRGGNTDIATMGLIGGFIVMMCLDVALG